MGPAGSCARSGEGEPELCRHGGKSGNLAEWHKISGMAPIGIQGVSDVVQVAIPPLRRKQLSRACRKAFESAWFSDSEQPVTIRNDIIRVRHNPRQIRSWAQTLKAFAFSLGMAGFSCDNANSGAPIL